jgi:hydrogenase maturation protein HypF
VNIGSENALLSLKSSDRPEQIRLSIKGLVQGVGFRPFVYRLARELCLSGWIKNTNGGVEIEIEGDQTKLHQFTLRLKAEQPPRSRIDNLRIRISRVAGHCEFVIRESDDRYENISFTVTPDIATCNECMSEVLDPANRRYQYPFTNCTNCGPRFSIIESLPYDRINTTMKAFTMCDACRSEYENPANRRFHAQPNACPKCGPHLELWNRAKKVLTKHNQALHDACDRVKNGNVLALKGLGGFQLIVDAGNDDAIRRLRNAKTRVEKPFALMCADLSSIEQFCEVSAQERRLLDSPESPIVLLKRRIKPISMAQELSPLVAPGNPYLGIMLPYTPLHHLMMNELKIPIIATSGNLADEPICIDENEAVERLGGIADYFLIHNRPIARHVDDSVVQFVAGNEMALRSARGYTPVTISMESCGIERIATGADTKNTIALSDGENAVVSQHIGDLSTKHACDIFTGTIDSLITLYGLSPEETACDAHPDYRSARLACKLESPATCVQHHLAHVMSCVAEQHLQLPVLGVVWDGTGYGMDGTVWGGEFLRVSDDGFSRVAHLRQFGLPGGERAMREPRRSALGLLYEILGDRAFEADGIESIRAFRDNEKRVIRQMLRQSVNTPLTSSAGRLFDAVASITGLCQSASYEGEAAMKVQFAAETHRENSCYEFALSNSEQPVVVDWELMVLSILDDMRNSVPVGMIASRFHNTLVQMITAVAEEVGETHVVLTGGCFQNRYLAERSINELASVGYVTHINRIVPPNDGGIALGQLAALSHNTYREI